MGLIELSLWDKLKRIKADKVVGAVEGNFAKLDANGNLVDSGHKDADYEDADATILKEADVVDSLDSTSTTAPLSANQGKVLKDAQDVLNADDTTEGSVAKSIKDAVDPIIENVSDHETRIQKLEFMPHVSSWADVQSLVRAGNARAYFPVGTQFSTLWDGVERTLEVIGIDHDTPTDTAYTHSLTLQFKDCLQNAQYSAPQALFNAVEGLDAGSYTFINSYDSLHYTFTLTKAVPVGGVIVITSWGAGTYEPTALKTMQADRLTNIETGVALTQASGGTALAPVNFVQRGRYGSNRYIKSGIRNFLNDGSDSYVWVAQGLYDMPSTYGAGGGFLKRLDADFASVIGPVVKKVARATVDGGGQDTMEDKVWLLSMVEMGYGTEGVTTGEQVYERWNGATNAERIKLVSGSPQAWWLRSPSVSTTHASHRVAPDGTVAPNICNYTYRIAPGLAVY